MIFSALSVATLNFLGFDGITTLSEEARGGARAVGRAIMISLCLAAVLFIAATWLASLFVLDRASFPPGPPTDGAFYAIAEIIGGKWFLAMASSKVLVAGVAVAAAAQIATARLIYGMARDGKTAAIVRARAPDASRAASGHPADRGRQSRHRPRLRPPVRAADHAGVLRRAGRIPAAARVGDRPLRVAAKEHTLVRTPARAARRCARSPSTCWSTWHTTR